MTGFVDLFGLDFDGVAAALILAGGFHLESLSHEGFGEDFGVFIQLEVSLGLGEPDGHCHDDGGAGVVGVAGNLQFGLLELLGVAVVVGNLQFGLLELLGVVVELFLGFRITLFGQLNFKPAGTLARYLGCFISGAGPVEFVGGSFRGLAAVGVGVLRSEEFLGATLL